MASTYLGYFTRVEGLAVLDICFVLEQLHVIDWPLVHVGWHANRAFVRILQHFADTQIVQALYDMKKGGMRRLGRTTKITAKIREENQ